MSDERPPFEVIEGGLSKSPPRRGGEVDSPGIPPLANLTGSEKRVWDYICASLRAAGVEHLTAGIAIKLVCATYVAWTEAAKLCETPGRYGTSANGNSYELPHSYTEKQTRKELLRWLPEVALTIPSLVAAKAKMPERAQQDDLFDDMVQHANADRAAYGRQSPM